MKEGQGHWDCGGAKSATTAPIQVTTLDGLHWNCSGRPRSIVAQISLPHLSLSIQKRRGETNSRAMGLNASPIAPK
ncbi:hypothetical protein CRG98_001500 [Punica granatum]|uniref:Uncharacterized protein n=1 Tax=Punica granatum TaxID=22663 RepID=A0A2I0LBW1_PUNGR|nr:hypothetical protein CRG98_001500 [Punica granatum]